MNSGVRGGRSDAADCTVLVVEDDRDLADTYRFWLDERGDVDAAFVRRGAAALDRLADGGIDVLVLDRELPDVSGPEVVASGETGDVAVAVVSAYEPDRHLSGDDVDAYVVKPVARAEFLDALDAVA